MSLQAEITSLTFDNFKVRNSIQNEEGCIRKLDNDLNVFTPQSFEWFPSRINQDSIPARGRVMTGILMSSVEEYFYIVIRF